MPADSKQARTFLNHIYKRYDADYDGKITRTEFEQGLTMIGVRATFDEVNSLMTDLDKNEDGVISFDELSVVIGDIETKAEERSRKMRERKIRNLCKKQGTFSTRFLNIHKIILTYIYMHFTSI